MVVTKDGAPAEEGHYKANVDVRVTNAQNAQAQISHRRTRQQRIRCEVSPETKCGWCLDSELQ